MSDPFDIGALVQALNDCFAKPRAAVAEQTKVYTFNEGFGGGGVSPYWGIDVPVGRLESTRVKELLYRPDIVNAIVKNIEQALTGGGGVKVKGPHGVGKSHSLVNVVRKLESTGKYLVTFLPDCEMFVDLVYLYDSICKSFGSTREALKVNRGNENTQVDNFNAFIDAIDMILEENGKQWVFIFDQMNPFFAKFRNTLDVGLFDFPFNQICHLVVVGRRTSVISSSANNETTQGDNHPVFNKYTYNHPLRMSKMELFLVFPALQEKSEADQRNIRRLTGRVPWQVHRRLELENTENLHSLTTQEFDEKYTDDEITRITQSLKLLKEQHPQYKNDRWKDIVKAATSCVMQVNEELLDYDRKYSIYDEQRNLYKPLYPLVRDAYQSFFWEDLVTYVEAHEMTLLDVCDDPEVTTDVMGRIFELLVIRRCGQGPIAMENSDNHLPERSPFIKRFPLQTLPREFDKDGMYVPQNSHFPAIDLIWKNGNDVWGVKVHVNDQNDELTRFSNMCTEAGWNDNGKDYNVHLVYLSPEEKVADLIRKHIKTDGTPKVQVLCCKHIACLSNLIWPTGCSLNKKRKRTSSVDNDEASCSSDEGETPSPDCN